LTVLPSSSLSRGTWEEIRYGGALGKAMLYLFRRDDPETEFQEIIRKLIANLSTHPNLVYITFDGLTDLFDQIDDVWRYTRNQEPISESDWQWVLDYVQSEPDISSLVK
jgi:hypothetical protein